MTGSRTAIRSLLLVALLFCAPVYGWNAKAHRLAAAIAYEQLTAAQRDALAQLLQQHPRFERDFQAQMPASVASSNADSRQRWLLGQAAVWPDLARQLPERERQRYHRPAWHYIDGRWMPPATAAPQDPIQGNVYLGAPLPDIAGQLSVDREADVGNMLQALDYNRRLLHDNARSPAERAVALCWVLHLVADIHQPLHSGALFSNQRFDNGDRGGNEIRTDDGNLHARWDQALGRQSFNRLLPELQALAGAVAAADKLRNSSHWLQESRELLHSAVYRTDMRRAILQSEQQRRPLQPFSLDEDYLRRMHQIALERVAIAGSRTTGMLQE